MSQPRTLEAKVIYRSNHSQLAMISIMKHGGIWERLGLDVTRMDLERRALPAEDQLLNGRCNMIFGCHITPHWRVAHDVPMICMAQTVKHGAGHAGEHKAVGRGQRFEGPGSGRTRILR
jgi:hypothetical protein